MLVFLTVQLVAFFVFDNLVVGTFFMGLLFGVGGAIAAVATYVMGTRRRRPAETAFGTARA